MPKRDIIHFNNLFFFIFIAAGVLNGAQRPEALGVREDVCMQKAPVGTKRPMADFAVGEDTQGFCRISRDIVHKDRLLIFSIRHQKSVQFDAVEKEATRIYKNGRPSILWGQILNAVRREPLLDVDYIGQRFVVSDRPMEKHPTERIEKAIYRIYEENPSTTKRDCALMVYAQGYRDYTYESIIAKRRVLVCAGFCPNISHGPCDNMDRFIDYWWLVKWGTDQERETLFCQCDVKDVDAVYQMIYMHKHDLIAPLGKEIAEDSIALSDDARKRQDKILHYLQERVDTPCQIFDIARSVLPQKLPKGVVYEIASMVFLGKIVVAFDAEKGMCTLVSSGVLPTRAKDQCDELVFWQKLRRCKRIEDAILATYLQGHRTYPPAKMVLFKNGFDIVNIDGKGLWGRAADVVRFLQKYQCIPPLWQWDADMEQEGRPFLMGFCNMALDALFEMHNRGALDVVRSYAQFSPKTHFSNEGIRADVEQFLGLGEACDVRKLAGFLRTKDEELARKQGNWHIILSGVRDFIENVHYDIEKDEFTWIDHPEPLEDKTVFAEVEHACILRNRYPRMALQCMTFLLLHKGFELNLERGQVLFHALDVAGLVLSEGKRLPHCSKLCKEIVAFLQGKESEFSDSEAVKRERLRNLRVDRIVSEALSLCKNEHLKTLAQQTNIVQKCGPRVYKRSSKNSLNTCAKRQKCDSAENLSHEECGAKGVAMLLRAANIESEGQQPRPFSLGLDLLAAASAHKQKEQEQTNHEDKTCKGKQL